MQKDEVLELVKKFTGKNCPFRRIDEIEIKSEDEFPLIIPNPGINDFSSENNIDKRATYLKNPYSIYDQTIKTCYLKDSIFNNKTDIFKNSVFQKYISEGEFGKLLLYSDKKSKLPFVAGKYNIYEKNTHVEQKGEYKEESKQKDLLYKEREQKNYNLARESLLGLELLNKCRYFLPNYPYNYGLGFCNIGENETCGKNGSNSGNDPILFQEYIENSVPLSEFIMTPNFSNNIENIFLQIFNALNILQMMNGLFTHKDLHINNVLVQKTKKELLLPIYIFHNNVLEIIKYIKTNYIIYIIDFGLSTYLSYEALIKKYQEKSTKYAGLSKSDVKQYFILGDSFKRYLKEEKDHEYDIMSIIKNSAEAYVYKINLGNNPEHKVTSFLNIMLSHIYTVKHELPNQEDFLIAKISQNEKFLNYNQVVHFIVNIFGNRTFRTYTKEQVLLDKKLNQLTITNCLNKDCKEGLNFTKRRGNSLLDEELVKNFFVKRNEEINAMLEYLANNYTSKQKDAINKVEKILSYIRKYRNNDEILDLVAKLYGVLFPEKLAPGITKYIYLYKILSGYYNILDRENINKDGDIKYLTQDEILKYKGIKLNYPYNLNKYHDIVEIIMSKNKDLIDKVYISTIIGTKEKHPWDLFAEFQNIANFSDTKYKSFFKNVFFNNYDIIDSVINDSIEGEIDNSGAELPYTYLNYILKSAIKSNNLKYIKYYSDLDNLYFKSREDMANIAWVQTLQTYAKNFYFDQDIFDFLVSKYGDKMKNLIPVLIKTYDSYIEKYGELDDVTKKGYLLKYDALIRLENARLG